MKRTARLVQRALAGRPAPEAWSRGAADVAAAVARSGGGGTRHEGGPGGASAGGPGSPGGVSSRALAQAAGGPGGVISSRVVAHAAGIQGGVISSRDLTHAAGGLGGGSGRELAHAVLGAGRRSGREGTHVAMEKTQGGGKSVQVIGQHCSHQGGQGGREAKEKDGQAEPVGYKAKDAPAASTYSKGGQGGREAKEYLQQPGIKGGQAEPVGSKVKDAPPASASWKVCASVIHDKDFVPNEKLMDCGVTGSSVDEEWTTNVDVSQQITSCLINYAGPVLSFRIDSSKWTHDRCLEEWLVLLSDKSVQSLELLNVGHKISTIFPIENVQSKDLRVLRIGFFRVPLDLHCFNYSSLNTLDFFCCALETKKLSWIVTDCHSLKVLKIHCCSIDLHINSTSLEVLDSFGNTGNKIVVVSAPKLLSVGCGMIPVQKSKVIRQRILASVSLNVVPMLKVLKHLMIPYHRLTLNNKDLTKDVLPSVERLELSLEMSNSAQLQDFRKLLESFPMLQHLSVERMDSIGHNEGFDILIEKPFDDMAMVDCVKISLTTFSLLEFRGGSSEKHLVQSLLKDAQNLKLLRTCCCVSVPNRNIRQVVKQMKSYDRASEACQLIFG